MSVRKQYRDGKAWWIADFHDGTRRHQVRFKTKREAAAFESRARPRPPSYLTAAEIAADWFTLPPTLRTKAKLLEMLS